MYVCSQTPPRTHTSSGRHILMQYVSYISHDVSIYTYIYISSPPVLVIVDDGRSSNRCRLLDVIVYGSAVFQFPEGGVFFFLFSFKKLKKT